MLDKDTLITLFNGTVQNLAYNLDFVPADKLNWKPAPSANSALEVVNHLTEWLGYFIARVNPALEALPAATNLEEAKDLLNQTAERFTTVLRGASDEQLGEMVQPDGVFTVGRFAVALIMDAVHHHGQIAYIQTLLGDTESHFDMSAIADFNLG